MNGSMGWRRCAGRSRSWQLGVLAAVAAAVAMLAVACGGGGGSPSQAGSSHPAGYRQYHGYSQCMRSFPILKQGPGGTLVHPLSPPAGMLTSARYDAAFRACLKLAVIGGGSRARYRATALKGLQQAECMRVHGITGYPSPATLVGGLHVPDFTAIGLDPHTLQFLAAGQA
jgi:hypothetical protein